MRVPWVLTSLCLLVLATAGPDAHAGAGTPLEAFVSVAPQAYLVERVGGDHVTVHVLVQPGREPHTFEPTPKQMMALGRAGLYFKVGVPFETRLLAKIQGRPGLTVVDTATGIRRRMMAGRHHGEHEGPGHEPRGHAERGEPQQAPREHARSERRSTAPGADEHDTPKAEPDPHIWLSPPLIKVQAANIADALVRADPAHQKDYQENLAAFLKDVDATHARVSRVLAPYKGQSFYVFHPAFGYFGDAYGLKQVAVEAEGKMPTPRQLAELIKRARSEKVHIIFVQPQFDKRSVESMAKAIDGAVVPMDPLARDVLRNLQDMAAKVERALKKETPIR